MSAVDYSGLWYLSAKAMTPEARKKAVRFKLQAEAFVREVQKDMEKAK